MIGGVDHVIHCAAAARCVMDGSRKGPTVAELVAEARGEQVLLNNRGVTMVRARDVWPLVLGGVAMWAAQRCLAGLLVRFHRREGDLSVMPD